MKLRNQIHRSGFFSKVALAILLMSLPTKILLDHYRPDSGFLSLIYFGDQFAKRSLAAVQKIDPPKNTRIGYDGQFYAQLALSPTLQDPQLAIALDNPSYRAQKIGLPILSYLFAFGNPYYTLQIYSLINYVFWIGLLLFLFNNFSILDWRDPLLFLALFWTTGTLTCLSRALTDFPSTVLCLMAILGCGHWIYTLLGLSFGALIKETSVLAVVGLPIKWEKKIGKRLVAQVLWVLVPCLLWYGYVQYTFAHIKDLPLHNFDWPLLGLVHKLTLGFGLAIDALVAHDFWYLPRSQFYLLFELLAPISLVVQVFYLLHKPLFNTALWRYGALFAVLMLFLGSPVWNEQYAYTRVLLPLTFVFNLLIHKKEKGRAYWIWLIAGNIGLSMLALEGIF